MEDLRLPYAHCTFASSPHRPARSHLQATGLLSRGKGENRRQAARGVGVRLLAGTIRLSSGEPLSGAGAGGGGDALLFLSPAPRPAHLRPLFGTAGTSWSQAEAQPSHLCAQTLPTDLW